MWLSKQQKQEGQETPVDTGEVTMTGDTVAVELDSERRGLAVYAPGGYQWRPSVGQKVLVLKTGEGPCVVGAPAYGGRGEGEIRLSAPGGAIVTLYNDGRVVMSKDAEVTGTLTVEGEELKEMIRRIAIEVVASMVGL